MNLAARVTDALIVRGLRPTASLPRPASHPSARLFPSFVLASPAPPVMRHPDHAAHRANRHPRAGRDGGATHRREGGGRRTGVLRLTVEMAALLSAALTVVACGESGTAPSRARVVIDRATISMHEGRIDTATATAYDAAGRVITSPITWSSADRRVAWVDTTGEIHGVAPGRTTITATAGTLSGTAELTVLADSGRPQLGSPELSRQAIDLTGGDAALVVRVRARDLESGIHYLLVSMLPPTPSNNVRLRQYCAPTLESGTRADGTWSCTVALHHYTAPGTWRLTVTAYDWRPLFPNGDSTTVAVTVTNPRTDDTPPTLDDLTFTSQRVNEPPYGESRLISVTAHDDESGVLTIEYGLDSDTQPGVYGCGAERPFPPEFPWQPARTVTGTCPLPLVASSTPVYRTFSLVRLTDARGNVRTMTRDDLERAGFVTRIDIRK